MHRPWLRSLGFVASCALIGGVMAGCLVEGDDPDLVSDESAIKFVAPKEGSCEALGMLAVVNDSSMTKLDVDVKLTSTASKNIVAARPLESIRELDAVPSVGPSALTAILKFARDEGFTKCGPKVELGVISDLDDTVIPPANPELSRAPYPGVAKLYQVLELRNGGVAGDVRYVTARVPARVAAVPAYLELHGVPVGPIETGISGIPQVAENEKVKDITKVLAATGQQRFVLFGDATHRDPEVYARVLAASPDRIAAVIIHREGVTVPKARVAGMHLVENYAEASAVLFGLGLITRAEALSVMKAAKTAGLEISDSEMQALLDGG